MTYPAPEIGFYRAECCLMDLHKIETADDLADVMERVSENGEVGSLMVFRTLAEAVAHLSNDLDPEDERKEFARLGWIAPDA